MDKFEPIEKILPIDEYNKLKDIEQELSKAWNTRQIFRTETEARYAVLNDFKFPTKASKYWQAVREQTVHFDELTRLSFEIRRKQIDLEEVEEKINDNKKEWYKEPNQYTNAQHADMARKDARLNIDRDELLYTLSAANQIAKDRVREILQWSAIKKEVNDGSFDDNNVNTHQAESLFKSVLNRAQAAPNNISSEERISLVGMLNGLKDIPVNQEFIKSLTKKD